MSITFVCLRCGEKISTSSYRKSKENMFEHMQEFHLKTPIKTTQKKMGNYVEVLESEQKSKRIDKLVQIIEDRKTIEKLLIRCKRELINLQEEKELCIKEVI